MRTIVILPIVTIIAVVVACFVTRTAFALLFLTRFLTSAEIGEHAEIMVGELQMIFGVDAVVVELRVLREFLVFFEHLARVAARAVVDAVVVIETAAIVLLLPAIIVIIPTATPVVIIIRLATVVVIHKG